MVISSSNPRYIGTPSMTERTIEQLLNREKHLEYVQDLLNKEITRLSKELQAAKTKLSVYEKKTWLDKLVNPTNY